MRTISYSSHILTDLPINLHYFPRSTNSHWLRYTKQIFIQPCPGSEIGFILKSFVLDVSGPSSKSKVCSRSFHSKALGKKFIFCFFYLFYHWVILSRYVLLAPDLTWFSTPTLSWLYFWKSSFDSQKYFLPYCFLIRNY